MVVLYQILFALSVFFLLWAYRGLTTARLQHDTAALPMLRWMTLGMGLTALSYLFRIRDLPRPGHVSFFGFLFCLGGTIALSIGWAERIKLRAAREQMHLRPQENRKQSGTRDHIGSSGATNLSLRALQVLLYAYAEADQYGQEQVDTDHLLLGLLREPCGVGVQILHRLGLNDGVLRAMITDQMAAVRRPVLTSSDGPTVLTQRAQEVLDFAAQESRRFDSPYVGTEHLLLGLVLKGTGPAASILFQQGVTVDQIRQEILNGQRVLR